MPPSLANIASVFIRYANLTFGGGSPTIAVLHREIVTARQWINETGFTLCYALCRLTPCHLRRRSGTAPDSNDHAKLAVAPCLSSWGIAQFSLAPPYTWPALPA